jgi:hypothetical protein
MTGYPAAPGQSLNDLTQARLQQQYTAMQQQQQQPMMPMMTGMPQQQQPQMTGMPQQFMQQGAMPMQMQPTGFGFPQQQQPQMTGMPQQQQQQGPFMSQPTGMGGMGMPQQQMPQPTGMGGMGMPQMQPQPTGFGGGGGLQPPTMQPLVPQKTGPPPPVRFGVSEAQKKLAPQATGRRANLAAASELFFFCFSSFPPFFGLLVLVVLRVGSFVEGPTAIRELEEEGIG